MPTPVGPAPRDPNDPDFWDWGDDVPGLSGYHANGGHDDRTLRERLHRQRRRRQLIALVIVVLVLTAIIVSSL